MIARARSVVVLAFVLGALAACRSASTAAVTPLPFHVAIIPFEGERTQVKEDSGSKLDLSGKATAEALTSTLDGRHFTRATLLTPPQAASALDLSELTPAERNTLWVMEARSKQADLLMTCKLEYDDRSKVETNNKWPFTGLLFLIGGPLSWLIDDQEYTPSVRLSFGMIDLRAVEDAGGQALASGDPLDSPGSVLLDQESTGAGGVSMNLIERAGGGIGWYFVSIVVPATLLARETDAGSAEVRKQVIEDLCQNVAEKLHSLDRALLKPNSVPFHLGENTVVKRIGAGKAELRGQVFLRGDSSVQNLESCTIYPSESNRPIGVFPLEGKVLAQSVTTPLYTYDVALPFDLPPGVTAVRVEITDRGSSTRSRSFTLPVL